MDLLDETLVAQTGKASLRLSLQDDVSPDEKSLENHPVKFAIRIYPHTDVKFVVNRVEDILDSFSLNLEHSSIITKPNNIGAYVSDDMDKFPKRVEFSITPMK